MIDSGMDAYAANRRSAGLGYFQILPDEIICSITELISPVDLGILSCVSSIFYIFCNEEPLWMKLCLQDHMGLIKYFGTWKQTVLRKLKNMERNKIMSDRSINFHGFTSMFLYRRWYRCNVDLGSFAFDSGMIERKYPPLGQDFIAVYDGKKPILLCGLADDWQAMQKWNIDYLVEHYGGCVFKVAQNGPNKVRMHFEDYVSYMTSQHDEDPLYIFDPKFGETAAGLLQDYEVPQYFKEDLFTFMDEKERPHFRWLVIGPMRSGASWHVDPALTSAWNTLIRGQKRWALYPPGRVPPGVVVHADEGGDVDVDSPSSLQWWLDVYPMLKDEDKPLECTQFPGETIFVPSGWWHCVLNLETSVAITQNFVNLQNFELVCMDLVPGCHHRGIARVGHLALQEHQFMKPKETCFWEFSMDFLASYMEDNLPVSNAAESYSSSQCVRKWLWNLWFGRMDLRPRVWKSACITFGAASWLEMVMCICKAHSLPAPTQDEQLPVGNGSSPVFLIGGYAVKICLDERSSDKCIDGLTSELQFYSKICQHKSPLERAIPVLIASGILHVEEDWTFKAVPWDGKGEAPYNSKKKANVSHSPEFLRTRWFQAASNLSYLDEEDSENEEDNFSGGDPNTYPYLITARCEGNELGRVWVELGRMHSSVDGLRKAVAITLGEHVRHLHSLSLPCMPEKSDQRPILLQHIGLTYKQSYHTGDSKLYNGCPKFYGHKATWICEVPWEWQYFVGMMRKQHKCLQSRLHMWHGTVPDHLLCQLEGYLPVDPVVLVVIDKNEDGIAQFGLPVWLHMDLNNENIQVVFRTHAHTVDMLTEESNAEASETLEAFYILDFGDVALGDPLYELVSIHLDVFEGNFEHLRSFLKGYRLPLTASGSIHDHLELPYRAMCYSILHGENALGAIFKIWKELKTADTWKEVEEKVWGVLDEYAM